MLCKCVSSCSNEPNTWCEESTVVAVGERYSIADGCKVEVVVGVRRAGFSPMECGPHWAFSRMSLERKCRKIRSFSTSRTAGCSCGSARRGSSMSGSMGCGLIRDVLQRRGTRGLCILCACLATRCSSLCALCVHRSALSNSWRIRCWSHYASATNKQDLNSCFKFCKMTILTLVKYLV